MIKVLDENTINKISAGEVIERPLNIVKELLENSIDANSTKITIEIEDGGKSLIRVIDNGCGFEKNEMKLAFLRHATSKITNISDLQSLNTLGFRGEALASIASVSKVSLESKKKENDFGYKYNINFGKGEEIVETSINDGTIITIRELFENIQVRKNFLSSSQTESSKIYDIIEKVALSNPSISFRFIIDGKEKFHTSGDRSLKNIIYTLYGKECVNNLIEINNNTNFSINGYIANAEYAKNNRLNEIFFINNRYIKNQIITKAIEEAYKPYLMQHKFPFVILNINIDPEIVDVNVHPQKMEVRFSNNNIIYTTIYSLIKEKLRTYYDNTFFNSKINNEEKIFEDNTQRTIFNIAEKNTLYGSEHYEKNNDSNEVLNRISIKNTNNDNNVNSNINYKSNNIDNNHNINNDYISLQNSKKDSKLSNIKILGQLFDTYILVELNDILYVIDQHAAHEKVYYEKMMKKINDTMEVGLLSQKIFPEIILILSIKEIDSIKLYKDYLLKIGFTIEIFGEREVKISTIPFDLPEISKKELLLELINDLSNISYTKEINIIQEKIASMACKKAVKAHDRLNQMEINTLINDLFNLQNPNFCPHGRPTIFSMSHYELDKKFKRII
ncbi:MAG: DNA mismatch repair endonuclease MutL [Eubacteriales bacterium]|nr:DNA mismatch repair endonuclease MutL [Eubacteriales bacterium]